MVKGKLTVQGQLMVHGSWFKSLNDNHNENDTINYGSWTSQATKVKHGINDYEGSFKEKMLVCCE